MNGGFFGLLAVLSVIGLIAFLVLLAPTLLARIRWNRPVEWSEEPVPDAWPKMVRSWFPLSRTLDSSQFDRLLRMVQVFVRDKRFEGAGGFEVTDEVRVVIAAQACYLVLGIPGSIYPSTRSIIVYPSAFVARRDGVSVHGGISRPRAALLGESWVHGTVLLSWESVVRGAANSRDGKNLIFHEFAHQLDQEDGEGGGIPPGMKPGALRKWASVLNKRFKQLQRAEEDGKRTVLDYYGATNQAEFFAVAVEAFFEKPRQLAKAKPDLYSQLSSVLRRDPVKEQEA